MINQFIQEAFQDSFCPQIKSTALELNKLQSSPLFHVDCKLTKKKICTCSGFISMPLIEQKNQRILQSYLQHELEGIKSQDYEEALFLREFYQGKIENTQEVEKQNI